ncbi:MAG: Xaa-Pro peptidase family protein [Proteobacteria bacterium]|nr:Xaa-Pro peptidase family protein [Pseudomonadota bacterium]
MDDRDRTARSAPGMMLHDTEPQPDMARMRAYRLGRFQAELRRRDLGGALLFDSVNIRYASGTRNGAIFNFHTPSRALFVPPEGKAILYDQAGWAGPVLELGTVGEVHDMPTFSYFYVAERGDENAGRMAAMVEDELARHAGANKRLAVDRIEASLINALQGRGIELADAQGPAERARIVKSDDEIACMLTSITVAETGISRISEALRPGMTENELFSILHQTNIANGGDWCEYRLLASGARTNPWGQECSDKVIRAGELVAFDTGMVGRYGYATDMSRTLFCEPGKPSAEQRRLYAIAYENLHTNLELVRAGLGFREFAEKAWVLPDEFVKHRYPTPIHGIGMTDEWPMVKHLIDWEEQGYDGVFEAGMTVSVESFIGGEHGVEGVKLEEQVLITETGYQRLSTYPYDDRLLG